VIGRLSDDLSKAFPEMRGFRPSDLKYMRSFAEAYPDQQFMQQVVAQLPWGIRSEFWTRYRMQSRGNGTFGKQYKAAGAGTLSSI
jgi:hypothetical protein